MKKIIFAACIGLLGLASCDSNLDVTPKTKVGIDDYFKSATDLELYCNQFYPDVLDDKPYSYQDDHIVKQTLSAELLCGRGRVVPATGGGWTWKALRKFNTLLEYAPKNCQDEAAVKKYSAVARFFRAYFYYEKIRRFGDVPWIDRQLFSTDAELYAPRDSRELVMTHMIEDIDYAIENLPNNSTEKNLSLVTKGAALALKSRFCLFEGTFRKYHKINLEGHDYNYYLEQAADAANKLITEQGTYGKYALYNTGNPTTDYRDLFTQVNAEDTKSEYILACRFSQTLSYYHNANGYCVRNNQGKPAVTRKLVASYLMKDGSRFTDKTNWQTMSFTEEMANRDPRLAQTIRSTGYKRIGGTEVLPCDFEVSTTGYQPIKYVTQTVINGNNCDDPTRSLTDMPVFRYAEVLLNYAEAKAELGTLSQADLDKSINLIRKRAGMPDMKVGNSVDPFMIDEEYGYRNCKNGDVLEIRRERAIELFQEHLRYYDLMRWKEGMCVSQPIYGIYVAGPGGIDMTGDGKDNVYFYANGTTAPKVDADVKVYELGKDIKLSQDTKGNTCNHHDQDRQAFDESRDYYFPIPTEELLLNTNLVQNPNWK